MPNKDPAARRAYNQAYKKANRERLNTKERERYDPLKESVRKKAERSGNNREEFNAKERIRYASRRTEVANMRRKLRMKGEWTVERYLQTLLHMGTKKRARSEHITLKDLISIWDRQNGICAVSGVAMTHMRNAGRIHTNASVDRIDNAIGYTLGNIRLVCVRVNIMRGAMTDEELRSWCVSILANSPTSVIAAAA